MTALLLLAGCLGTEDVEDVVEDVLEVVGCGDETALNYVANVTNATDDLCVHEDSLETAIVDFITIIENGPNMETLDTTVGYSMEMSEVYPDVSAHYMETTVISPTGFKSTMEHTIDGITESSEIIISGNEIQFHIKNSTEDFTVRMKHAETFEDAMEMMMSDDDDDDMGSYDDDMGSGDDEMVCYDMSTHMVLFEHQNQITCEEEGYMWVPASSGPSDDMDDTGEMADFGEVDVSDYTQYFDPLSATITGFAPDETGFTFSGSLNIDDAPFSYLEIHTDSDFNVLGFTMEDTEEEDNWVEFMMLDSGDTSTDDTIALSALPYILLDMSDSGDGDGDSGDGTYWEPYYGGYCEWEGNPDDDDNVWSCKVDESDSDWENWWYYCELHEGDWFCTDDYGQSSDYANSADNDRYTNGYDGGDDGGSDDDFTCDNGDTIPWDWVNDGYPDCEDGSDEFDDGPEEEVFHYYDNCTDEGNYYECWMDEWDHDGDGDYEESHGYNYEDCSLESNGSWKCFVGYADEDNEDVEYYYYDNCNYDNETDFYECVTPEGADGWENCELESNGTWRCWHDYDFETGDIYYCTPFVAQNPAGFSIFNDTNLDDSLCGMEVSDEMYEFDNSTFTMPTNLIWEDCWIEGNETVCEQGEIYYDVNTTMLWETTHENNYMDCDGDYDNNTSMCTEWIGNITDADGSAFLIVNVWGESLIMYQYDEATQSGLVISVESDDDDYDPEMWFNMFDANGDGEVNSSEWADFGNQSGEGMTEDDWNEILMLIEMFDEDNSSGLNLDEFTNMTESMGGGEDDDDDDDMDPETMFNMLDGNGDGEVTTSEWSDFSNSTDEPMSQEDFDFLSGMMDNYDDDDSGGLDFDEFMTFMDSMEDMEDGDGEDMKMYMVFGVLPYGADIDDYHVELAMCDGTSLADIECDDSIYSVALSEVMVESEEAAMMAMMTESIVFVDSDESGTLTFGDFVMINNNTLEVDGEWNFARLYSAEADSYSDENPMMSMLPGFTGFIATIGLLGAALIRRE